MKQTSIKSMLIFTAIITAFFAGWATHQVSNTKSSVIELIPDPAIEQFELAMRDPYYDPQTFRDDLTDLVESNEFVAAMRLLDAVRIDIQLESDGNVGYYSIGGNVIQNPGTDAAFDHERAFLMPGTGCCGDSMLWIYRTQQFAENYNSYRDDQASIAR